MGPTWGPSGADRTQVGPMLAPWTLQCGIANTCMCVGIYDMLFYHDDVIKWDHFPRYWTFVRGIHRSPVNSPHKGQWRGALMFSLICVWINDWVKNRKAGDLRRYHGHNDVIVMMCELHHTWNSAGFPSQGPAMQKQFPCHVTIFPFIILQVSFWTFIGNRRYEFRMTLQSWYY